MTQTPMRRPTIPDHLFEACVEVACAKFNTTFTPEVGGVMVVGDRKRTHWEDATPPRLEDIPLLEPLK